MDQREVLAQMLARSSGPPLNMSSWQPTPTSPFGGLEAFDWKHPGMDPRPVGTVSMGPDQEQLQLLHLLGRRRLPPALSGVGEVR
jgi:hypothetical protein